MVSSVSLFSDYLILFSNPATLRRPMEAETWTEGSPMALANTRDFHPPELISTRKPLGKPKLASPEIRAGCVFRFFLERQDNHVQRLAQWLYRGCVGKSDTRKVSHYSNTSYFPLRQVAKWHPSRLTAFSLIFFIWAIYGQMGQKEKFPKMDGFSKYGSVSKPCTPGEHQNSW